MPARAAWTEAPWAPRRPALAIPSTSTSTCAPTRSCALDAAAEPQAPDDAIQAAVVSTASPARNAPADCNVYLLQVCGAATGALGTRQSSLALSWGVARPMKRGGWTKVNTPSYHALQQQILAHSTRLPDDQACVRSIASLPRLPSISGSHAGQLRGPDGVEALQRAAQTGRLFLAGTDARSVGAQLRWAAPRTIAWHWHDSSNASDIEPVWTIAGRVGGVGAVVLGDPLVDALPSVSDGGDSDSSASEETAIGDILLFADPPMYLDLAAGCCGLAHAPGVAAADLAQLLAARPVPQSAFREPEVLRLAGLAGLDMPTGMPRASSSVRGAAPTACVALSAVPPGERKAAGWLRAQLSFDYAGLRYRGSQAESDVLVDRGDTRVSLQRDLGAEIAARRALHRLGWRDVGDGRHHLAQDADPAAACDWVASDFAALRTAGFVLEVDPALPLLVRQVDTLSLLLTPADAPVPPAGAAATWAAPAGTVAPSVGALHWFALSLGIEIDGMRQNVLPWLPSLLAQCGPGDDEAGPALPDWLWHERDDGSFVRLPSAPLRPWLQALLELVAERPRQDFAGALLRLSRTEALRLGTARTSRASGSGDWAGAEALRDLLRPLDRQGRLPDVPVPAGLQATLRPYQRHGLRWLQFLRAQHLAGILADDMGLGKTVQALAHMLAEQEAGRLDRPCLVIAPVSLLGNWLREAQRFAPSLRSMVWHGPDRHEAAAHIADTDLVIAPYSLLQRDGAVWQGRAWHLVVLDEAQNIGNAGTQAAQVAASLDTRHRLCLTGTPLQNHLGELWSLFHFLMPGFLGPRSRFDTMFRTPIERHGDAEQLARLRRRITPFLLRRGKAEVATELPARQEYTVRIGLDGAQADLYETVRLATERSVRGALAELGLAKAQLRILDALLKLRQVCCDPRLLAAAWPDAQREVPSAKLEQLMSHLVALVAEGRRVLVFSQFTAMLALIEAAMAQRGMAWTTLTGSTRDREQAIGRFTRGEVPVFLISLKAGGTGLNLPQADTVIHYDPWWNPAVEAQATGRAHRLGQTRQVTVYRLVAEGTIEERILDLQARKAALADSLYRDSAARAEPLFTEDDVAALLQPLNFGASKPLNR